MSQHDEEMEPIIPVEQALVPFEQTTLLGVRLPDNRVAALFSLLCESLHLDRSGQVRRIKADPAIADCLILARIETAGGPQVLNVLIAGAIPKWLSGIRPGKVAPELRPFLLALQREVVDVLYRHFFKVDLDQAPQPAPPQAQQLPRSALEMHIEAWQETEREWSARETRYEGRIAALEQRDGAARGEEPPPQAGRILSQAHIGQVYALARHHRRQSGEPISDMLRDLAETFGVADMSDIPDEGWDYILRWFWSQAQQ